MEGHKLEQTVHSCEDQLRKGDVDGFAKQLHNMPLEERRAIAAQIKVDSSFTANHLPSLSFAEQGDLKSANINKSGSQEHRDYDSKTGRVSSVDIIDFSLQDKEARQQLHYDSKTGALQSEDTSFKDGSVRHATFDAKTGMEKSRDYQDANGYKSHEEYDANGRLKTLHERQANGSERDEYYAPNGGMTSIFHDRSKEK